LGGGGGGGFGGGGGGKLQSELSPYHLAETIEENVEARRLEKVYIIQEKWMSTIEMKKATNDQAFNERSRARRRERLYTPRGVT